MSRSGTIPASLALLLTSTITSSLGQETNSAIISISVVPITKTPRLTLRTSELRVRSVEGTTLPPRKKNSPTLYPTDPIDHITGRARVTLEVNDQRCPLITTMRPVPLLVD
ncbi:hypothetical protein FCV25MIE_17328 [Fagus crenata]